MIVKRYSKGFTLIEIMLAVALLGTILMVGSSFTTSWVAGNQVRETSSLLKSAVSQARMNALKNSQGAEAEKPVAGVCISNDTIQTVTFNADSADICNASNIKLVFKFGVSTGVSIKDKTSQTNITCLAFDSYGLSVAKPNCFNDLTQEIEIERSDEKVTVTII